MEPKFIDQTEIFPAMSYLNELDFEISSIVGSFLIQMFRQKDSFKIYANLLFLIIKFIREKNPYHEDLMEFIPETVNQLSHIFDYSENFSSICILCDPKEKSHV